MKVVEQTPSRLSLLASAKGVKIFGGLFLLGGICISVVLPSKTSESLICNRNESLCQIVRVGQLAGGAGTKSFPSDELKGANIKTNYSVDKKGQEHIYYDLVLTTKSYEDILFTGASEKSDLIGFTSEINNFVNNPVQPTFKLTSEKNLSTIKNVIFILACIIGVIALLQDEVIYTFDKNSKILFIKRQGFRGNRIFSEPSSNVSEVQVEQKVTKNSQNGKVYYFYNLNLLMTTGKKITLTSSSDRDECNKIANDIRKMLSFG
jgi:hypothetical protein